MGSFTPSVLLDLTERSGRLRDAGLAVTELAGHLVPGAVPLPGRRRAGRGPHQPRQRARLPLRPRQPARPAARRADRGRRSTAGMGLGLYARPGLTAADLRGAEVGVDVPAPGSRWRSTRWPTDSAWPGADYELVDPRLDPASAARRCSPASATATMLNAGNELLAEAAGCVRLAAAATTCRRTSAPCVAVVGDAHARRRRADWRARWSTPPPRSSAAGSTARRRESAARRLGLDADARRAVRRPAARPARRPGTRRRRRPGRARDPGAAAHDATCRGDRRLRRAGAAPWTGAGSGLVHRRVTRRARPGALPDPAAPAHGVRQHARPVRDAADAGGDRRATSASRWPRSCTPPASTSWSTA